MTNSEPATQNRFVLTITAVAALGGLLFRFDMAIISGAIPYIKAYFGLDSYTLGWAVSSILIGCAMGAVFPGQLADRLERRYMLLVCAVLFAASGIGAALSESLMLFVLFRLLGGLGVWAAAMISPTKNSVAENDECCNILFQKLFEFLYLYR